MTLFSALMRLLIFAPLTLSLSGCFPMGNSSADEEKDPHYLVGKNHLSSMDYDRAMAAFEKALAANPMSAAAHLQLGFLYEDKKSNYAAAIYHFEKHLELRPESNMAETVKQRVFSCTLELAKTVPFTLVTRQVQDDIRRLDATNSALRGQIKQLRMQLAEQAIVFSNQLVLASQISSPIPESHPQHTATLDRRPPAFERPTPSPPTYAAPRSSVAPRTHMVRPGETLATISRKYNIKLSALQNANPSVEPRKLRPGQVLSLPAPKN